MSWLNNLLGGDEKRKAKLTTVKVALELPLVGKLEGTWTADEAERLAAWELYVELVTRIAVVHLDTDHGSLREALSSLYSLFGTTRSILRKHGPGTAQPKEKGGFSFGRLSVIVLNWVIRPVLAEWHPELLAYEQTRDPTVGIIAHERAWDRGPELRDKLEETRRALMGYSGLLAEVAGVPSLIVDPKGKGEAR